MVLLPPRLVPTFASFDEGITYFNISEIKAFKAEEDDAGLPVTALYLRDGQVLRTERTVQECAALLVSVIVGY